MAQASAPATTAPAVTPAATPANPGEGETPPAKTAETPAQAEIRKLKLKLADREVELPEDQVVEIASQNTKAMYEAKKAEREHAAFMEKLKADPETTLRELGFDMDARAAERFAKQLEAEADEETLSPEAKELKALKAELARRDEAEQSAKAEQEKTTHQTKVEEAKARLRATVDEAVKVGGLSNSNFVRNLIVEKLRFNATNGLPIHPAVLASEVRETLADNFQDWLKGLSVDQVWEASEQFPEFRKEFVKRFAAMKGAKTTTKAQAKPAPKADTAPKKRSAAEEIKRLQAAYNKGIG